MASSNTNTSTITKTASDELQATVWFDTSKILIDGQWRDAASSKTLPIENPSTGATIGVIARGSNEDVEAAVAAARAASRGAWGRMTATERGRILMKMSALVLERADELAMIEALDVGKPLHQSLNDSKALARYLEFYAGAADKLMGDTIPYQDGFTVFTLREPHGVCGIIIPWNYPMQIVGRAVGAALAAGNSCVVKPAEDASVSTLAFAAIALEAGMPAGALNVVTGLGAEAGSALSTHPGIDHVSFTGSVGTGKHIQTAAAQNVIPVTLELGGKSPHIVFEDCDLDKAMPTLVGACMQNAGQTCSAASRVLVQRSIYDEVKQRMSELYRNLVAGPAVDGCDLGPLVSAKQKSIVSSYIDLGKAELNVAAEGTIRENAATNGHFVRAVLFSEVPPNHRLAQEEIFGPVQVLIPFEDEAEAIEIANGTPYGLVAGVWTRDGSRQMRMARHLDVGQVFLNNYGAGGGIELPFGGVGKSGHGREKGFEALYGFTRVKTVTAHHG
ncbi:aldehyde dehydrogenase family protein [Pollutimonas harenae]|uniref:Aldehyde dehydrogenase family protein n=1 Tax=Pollutimonas harenae TaxID=657015 RepID=A0A853H8A5_9BURK|nr:aldehyde dehydrogenase family protein [Pollutimonas harenae]NYT86713.1 aldehyde dehydrogenase family protein [Pollutimonas harenae]TEA71365.1 aldehyde dehydrogenase family protein [Pollutimonas harenae]